MGAAWSISGMIAIAAELGDAWPACADDLTPEIRDGLRAHAPGCTRPRPGRGSSSGGWRSTRRWPASSIRVDGVDLVITASNPDVAFAADGPLPDTFGGDRGRRRQQRPAHVPRQPPRQPGDLHPRRLGRRPAGRAAGGRPPLHRAAPARARPHRRTQPSLGADRARTLRRAHEGPPDRQRLHQPCRAALPRPDRHRRRAGPTCRVVGLADLPRGRRAGPRHRRRARRDGHRSGRAGGHGQPQLGPADHRPVRRVRDPAGSSCR